ncbi:hypothetical protein ACC691_36165, partial [Rhizobium johnstonii]|uniref:hypothetical protein n=1 Tax=Rhizobium johnstonii TaxID=3019933 RepID=UPI003F9A3060
WMEYRAGEYSSGTDSFEYMVIDTLGGRATAVVRIGISATPPTGAPVAVEDVVIARPGATVIARARGGCWSRRRLRAR